MANVTEAVAAPATASAESAGRGMSPANRAGARADCEALARALGGDVGDAVEAVQKLILRYYDDVREQATVSFTTARRVAIAGFMVLALTVGYLVVVDLGRRMAWFSDSGDLAGGMSVGTFGLVSGGIVEFLAAVQFLMHTRTTKQFGAFHICLERTHRYLLAYKIADTMHADKDRTLEKIVCIMANAPMITREDIEGVGGAPVHPPGGPQAAAAVDPMTPRT